MLMEEPQNNKNADTITSANTDKGNDTTTSINEDIQPRSRALNSRSTLPKYNLRSRVTQEMLYLLVIVHSKGDNQRRRNFNLRTLPKVIHEIMEKRQMSHQKE